MRVGQQYYRKIDKTMITHQTFTIIQPEYGTHKKPEKSRLVFTICIALLLKNFEYFQHG